MALAQELIRSAAKENPAFAAELGEATAVYDAGHSGATPDVAVRLPLPVTLTLDYWPDGGWYVGRLREMPSVFSQGPTLAELEENIRDAYQLVTSDLPPVEFPGAGSKRIGVEA